MKQRTVQVCLQNAFEARPLAELVQVASKYKSQIYLEAAGKKVNAKSIMGMMTLGLETGENLLVWADGEDEEAAVDRMESFLASGV